MSPPSIVSPEDQRVTFVELFFDLVFVFAVTQVVAVLHAGLSWSAVGRALLVFWLVWWAWTQFTWALNAADTTHTVVQLGTLLATAVAFYMAVALPGAFQDHALWFAVPYVLVRGIGLTLYGWVAAAADRTQHAAVRTFSLVSLGGLGAVLVGAEVGGAAQYWIWGLAILLDLIAAGVAGKLEGWNLHPEHFCERHGLFVIIALGESLIAAAGGLVTARWTPALGAVALVAVASICALWWTYFARAKPALDRALESCRGPVQSTMARDAFSLAHFPMLCGVIAYAAAVEEAVAHPGAPLHLEWRAALAAAVVLFVGGTAGALRRAGRRPGWPRTTLTATSAILVVALASVTAPVSMGIALAGATAVAVIEQRTAPA